MRPLYQWSLPALVGAAASCNLLVDVPEFADVSTGGSGGASVSSVGGSGGSGGGTVLVFRDDDQADFGAGNGVSAGWRPEGGFGLARPPSSGSFRSQVFDAGGVVDWNELRWQPRSPYSKPLPGGGQAETGYASHGVDMAENRLLLRFDGANMTDGTVFPDVSGSGNDAVLFFAGAVSDYVPGVFGEAWGDPVESYAEIALTPGGGLVIGTGEFTWALWVKTSQSCSGTNGNKVWIGTQDPGYQADHVWLGCMDQSLLQCSSVPGDSGGRLAGYFQTNAPAEMPTGFCGARRVNDDTFHHVAVVKRNVGNPAPPTDIAVQLYVDGAPDGAETPQTLVEALDLPAGEPYVLGRFADNDMEYEAAGYYDETVIFSRALSGEEIAALHRRGALRVGVRVRTCNAPDCSDRTDADFSPLFTDPATSLSPPVVALLDLPQARYAQYEIGLSSGTAETPVLDYVELRALVR